MVSGIAKEPPARRELKPAAGDFLVSRPPQLPAQADSRLA